MSLNDEPTNAGLAASGSNASAETQPLAVTDALASQPSRGQRGGRSSTPYAETTC